MKVYTTVNKLGGPTHYNNAGFEFLYYSHRFVGVLQAYWHISLIPVCLVENYRLYKFHRLHVINNNIIRMRTNDS